MHLNADESNITVRANRALRRARIHKTKPRAKHNNEQIELRQARRGSPLCLQAFAIAQAIFNGVPRARRIVPSPSHACRGDHPANPRCSAACYPPLPAARCGWFTLTLAAWT
jgi:hypothetical protein